MTTRDSAIRIWWNEGHSLLSRWTHDDRCDLTWVGHTCNAYHRWTRWVRPSWWLYVFAPYDSYWMWRLKKGRLGRSQVPRYERPTWNPRHRLRIWWPKVIWCRLTGHRGIVYYSSGMEPDNSCKGCGEEIA